MSNFGLDTGAALSAVLEGLSVNIRDQIRETLRLDLEDAEANGCPPEIGWHHNMADLLGSDVEYEIHDDYSGTLRINFGRFGDFEIEIRTNGEVIVWLLLEVDKLETSALDFTPDETMQLCVFANETIKLLLETDEDPDYDEFERQLEIKKANWYK